MNPKIRPALRRTVCGQSIPVLFLIAFVVLLIASAPARAQRRMPPTPYDSLLPRLDALSAVPMPDWKAHFDDLAHGEDPSLDDSAWAAMHLHDRWGHGPAWFRHWVEIPQAVSGYNLHDVRIRLDLRAGGEGASQIRVYFNGTLVEMTLDGVPEEPIVLTNKAEPGTKVLVAINIPAATGATWLDGADMLVEYPAGRPDPGLIANEIRSAYVLAGASVDGKEQRLAQLDSAVKAIDFAALDRSDGAAFEASLKSAQEKLNPLGEWARQFTVRAVGQSHIDMAWLWPWTETVEVVRNTFSSALQLMRQYPDVYYSQSTAAAFQWMEEKYPALFQQIQQRVKEGRWEIVGGMWVEPDLNLPSGESLVRQVVMGKRYFQQKFGVDVKIGWNPDSFGFSWQLPQIYKRSGIDFFTTQKMASNEVTQFPYKLFWWESPDGSRVLSYFPQGLGDHFDPWRVSYNVADIHQRTGLDNVMVFYGVGDHGGGPTRNVLDSVLRWQKGPNIFPPVTFSTAQTFFDGVIKDQDHLKIPVWKNELYFQHHRGVQTTQAETKKRMRRSEDLLMNAEKFASLATLDHQAYPQEEFQSDWEKVLFNQFHDILPGSGIAINYVDAARALHEVQLSGNKILSGSLDTIAARINTQGAGLPVVLFNPLSWSRTDSAVIKVQLPSAAAGVVVRDSNGATLPSAVVSQDAATHTVKVRVLARSVPAMGYSVLHVVPVPKPAMATTDLKARADGMENEFIRIKVDSHTGCITSMINKQDGREILAPGACGNLLQTFVDKPKCCDAWNIDPDFEDHMWNLTDAEEVKLVENTPLRAVIRVKKKFQSSSFVQNITMYPVIPRVDVKMQVDWHEQHILLKVAFPVSVESKFATYEIPYGNIERPTTRNTPEERAMFEVPAQQWGDLSDDQHGLSILNDCKYGYDAKGNVIRLSLLRSPTSPDPNTDQGFHEFTYSLYPHKGDWKAGETERRAYELNFPLIPVDVMPHTGVLPASQSLVQIEPGNVILTAVKKAYDSDALVFRFFEFEGKTSQVRLRLPQAAAKAVQTNLMEKQDAALPLSQDGKEVSLTVHPYEVVTVKADFGSDGNPQGGKPAGR